jgi:sterol desaturase/sphingolipid hydroxylase (fatty acid hydroxylase superfamily)
MNLFQIHFLCYWGTSYIFYLLDIYVYKNNIVEIYKQNKITERYWKYCYDSAKAALINQILVTYPIILLLEKNIDHGYYDFKIEFLRFLLYYIFADIYFFTLHYLCHQSYFLYTKIHKFHHRVYTTSAVSALDASPVEHAVINLGSFLIGYIIFGGHIVTIKIWVSLATINTGIAHSGYKHFLVGKEHNIHHRLAKHNYGQGLYILDRLLGTYILCDLKC